MKRWLITVLGCVLFSMTAHAQRLLPKQSGMEFLAGIPIQEDKLFSDGNFSALINYLRYMKNYHYYYGGVSYLQQDYYHKNYAIPVRDYLAEGGFMAHIISTPRKSFLVYAGLVASLGYEEINKGEGWLLDGAWLNAKNGFIFGGGAQLSFEGFITDYLVLTAKAKGLFMGGTDLDLLRPSVSVGIRIIM